MSAFYHRDAAKTGGKELSTCSACHTGAVENNLHFIMQCPAYSELRETVLARTRDAVKYLGVRRPDERCGPWSALRPVKDFDDLSQQQQMEYVLEKHTGRLPLDRSIDRACKKCLLRATKPENRS